jgi:hypothetical protein
VLVLFKRYINFPAIQSCLRYLLTRYPVLVPHIVKHGLNLSVCWARHLASTSLGAAPRLPCSDIRDMPGRLEPLVTVPENGELNLETGEIRVLGNFGTHPAHAYEVRLCNYTLLRQLG